MDQFPTSDEEFELTYGDDFELLREQEAAGEPHSKARRSLDFSNAPSAAQKEADLNDSFDVDVRRLSQNEEGPPNKKRTIQELFGDIDDLLSENDALREFKRCKTDRTELEMIDHIIELRKLAKERQSGSVLFGKGRGTSGKYVAENNLSYRVPNYLFFGVTRDDSERVYVRFHSEKYEKEELNQIVKNHNFENVMKDIFKDTWKEAEELINKQLDREENPTNQDVVIPEENQCLWVDLYKPSKYMELLSDETTNRTMLKWMKLWDKVVFRKKPKIKTANTESYEGKFKPFSLENMLKLDDNGTPEYKVALLCGPPGLGKTTLAHMVAKHAGYNVVEVNASDDRSTESFKTILKNATQMRSVVDSEGRPNCLVFDEIDGAPPSSIEYLIKFVTGKVRGKKGKEVYTSKRPIICICNDLYVPALRSLRQVAFVVNFPPTASSRLAERLMEIARDQAIRTDMGALMALCEKTNNDIRECLSVLHFYKSLDKPVTLSEVWKSSVGQKDHQKGLFTVWNDIFCVQRKGSSDDSLKSRASRVLSTVNSFGDYERVAQGVFENYPSVKIKDSTLEGTCAALEWFCFSDFFNRLIYGLQNYSLTTYLQYAFVVWHLVFATSNKPKIGFPNKGFEVRARRERCSAILTEVLRGVSPALRPRLSGTSLKLDLLPLLSRIIAPEFRAINLHLYTQKERDALDKLVGVMADYGLTYVQERTPEGGYVYNIDPNIDEVVAFPELPPKPSLSYASRQVVAFEIQAERARRDCRAPPRGAAEAAAERRPTKNQAEARDFFGRAIARKSPKEKRSPAASRGDIWYHFNEGYSNALRRPVKVSALK